MIKRHKIAFATLLGLLLFVGAASAYVEITLENLRENPPCGQLTGLAGVLQKAKLVDSSGNCAVGINGCLNQFSICQIQVVVRNPNPTGPPTITKTKTGICKNVPAAPGVTGCACVLQ